MSAQDCTRCVYDFDGFTVWHEKGCTATLGRPVIRVERGGKLWLAVLQSATDAVTVGRVIAAQASAREKCADCGAESDGGGDWHTIDCPRITPKIKPSEPPKVNPHPEYPLARSAREFQAATTGAQHVGRAHLARNIVNQILEQAVECGALSPGNERARQEFNDVADGFVVELLEEHDRTRDETIAKLRRGR